jgi:hypothetical protein
MHIRTIIIERLKNVARVLLTRQSGTHKFLRVRGYAEMLSALIDKYDPPHATRIHGEVRGRGGSAEEIEAVRLDALMERHGFKHA